MFVLLAGAVDIETDLGVVQVPDVGQAAGFDSSWGILECFFFFSVCFLTLQ